MMVTDVNKVVPIEVVSSVCHTHSVVLFTLCVKCRVCFIGQYIGIAAVKTFAFNVNIDLWSSLLSPFKDCSLMLQCDYR